MPLTLEAKQYAQPGTTRRGDPTHVAPNKARDGWILKPREDHLPDPRELSADRSIPEMVPVRLPVPPEAVLPGIQKSQFGVADGTGAV